MRILLLSPWFPSPPFGGALIRVYETIRHLAREHRVTLVAPVALPPAPEYLAPLSALCETVVAVRVSQRVSVVVRRLAWGLLRGRPLLQSLHGYPAFAREVRRLTSDGDYDIVHVEHSFMAPYLDAVSPRSRAKTVLSMHNIESRRFSRERRTARGARRLALLTDALFRSWEEDAIRRFDGIAVVSKLEEDWVHTHAPGTPTVMAPNGVDTTYFSPAPEPRVANTVVFTGLMNYPPNVDAAIWFCGAVLPLLARQHPGVRFRIVGDKPTDDVLALARRPGVDVLGRVPDIRPYLAEAAVVVVPLRSGAGTRLKILEAMATARAVVSTPQGAEGLAVSHGVNILLGETPAELTGHLSTLLRNADARARMAKAGRALVDVMYDWRSCLRSLDDLYRTVTRDGHSRARAPR